MEDEVGGGVIKTDVLSREAIDALLDTAREQVCELADEMRGGALRPCPDTCAWRGGCTYPSICRSEG
jgi:hypothetical protein